jgi:hypothetical protein
MDIATGKPIDGPRERWRPNLTIIKAVTHFVIETGRLQPKAWVDYSAEGEEGEAGREEKQEVASSIA